MAASGWCWQNYDRSWVMVDARGWSWVFVGGRGWSHNLVMLIVLLFA